MLIYYIFETNNTLNIGDRLSGLVLLDGGNGSICSWEDLSEH